MTSDLAQIEPALQTYSGGIHESGTERPGRVFREVAHLFSATEGKPNDLPRAVWFDPLRNRKFAQLQELPRHDRVVSVDRSGPATALAKVQCQIPSRYFTGYLAFVTLADGWKSVFKIFHTDTR
jgi:hypothetical protein